MKMNTNTKIKKMNDLIVKQEQEILVLRQIVGLFKKEVEEESKNEDSAKLKQLEDQLNNL
ncbi:hypothetical protein ACFL3T_04435 [Patescibacteria group bacterium]